MIEKVEFSEDHLSPLAWAIWSEPEFKPKPAPKKGPAPKPAPKTKIARTLDIIESAIDKGPRAALAFSGGSDSLVLLDLTRKTASRPYVIWIDTQMEWPGTRQFIKDTVDKYGLDLRIARADHTPEEQWARTGYPMLGKLAARTWSRNNPNYGYRINVSECCRALKIRPARRLTKALGCSVQITGQRGQRDDAVRGLRYIKDDVIFYQREHKVWVANPLTGWTDEEIRAYISDHNLTEHPAKNSGAHTIGCIYCGGGSQYTNSGLRTLRIKLPNHWRYYILNQGAGYIILSLKHKQPLAYIQRAIDEVGGLGTVAKHRPWVFDFTRKTPIPGYNK